MKRGLLVPMITAGMALATGVASANPQYWRDNGLLLEVSADPRDGTDTVQTNPTRAGRLELVALNDAVRLRGVTVHFSDGRTYTQQMSTIRVGERVTVDLPANCHGKYIQSVDLDYGRQVVERTPARLQIIPREDTRVAYPVQRDHRRYEAQPTYGYQQPSYGYQQPRYRTQPTYAVQPAPRRTTGWSGSIQGSIRF